MKFNYKYLKKFYQKNSHPNNFFSDYNSHQKFVLKKTPYFWLERETLVDVIEYISLNLGCK
jgi:hypothetical protein